MYEPDDKRVVLGTGNPFSASLPPGQYKITAEHTGGTATSFIYLYVLEGGTGAPRVRIFSPSDGATITSASGFDRHPYADVTLSGMAKAGNTKLTGSSIKWAVRVHGSGNAWTNAGTGATASVRLSDPRSGPTVYDVRLTATDSAGNSASDSVTVSVQL